MRFMAELRFVPDQQAAIRALVPQEQAHVQQLQAEGLLDAIYLSSDRTRVWIVMPGATLAEVQQRLAAFPMAAYLVPAWTPLA